MYSLVFHFNSTRLKYAMILSRKQQMYPRVNYSKIPLKISISALLFNLFIYYFHGITV